jgi:hypothetical protein
MSLKSHAWQWPNILSLDTALIAVAWQYVFSQMTESNLAIGAYLVLGLSVWLTYMADRLFDVSHRGPEQLLSLRHRFAKAHSSKLWTIWSAALITNITIAFYALNFHQLRNGFILLACCLLYTLLNQLLSRRFFPKELCVAAIYAGGVIVFVDAPLPWLGALSFAILCFINCLMVGMKERSVDAALRINSVTLYLHPVFLWMLFPLTLLSFIFINPSLAQSIGASLILLMSLQLLHHKFTAETFRVLTDTALLVGVVIGLI